MALLPALPAPVQRLLSLPERHPQAAMALLLGVLCVYPLILPNQYWLRVATTVGLYVILALGLNIVVGFCGLLDLGFVAFYGIGAYTAALATKAGAPFWLIIPVAMAFGAFMAALVGLPTLKLRGDYLAIVTVGFSQIIYLSFMNLTGITGGTKGVESIPPPTIPFTGWEFTLNSRYYMNHPYYYLVLAFIILTVISIWRLEHSRVGRAWKAIRENDLAASAMGIPVLRYKIMAYAIGAAYGGLAGCLMAPFFSFVAPKSFVFFESCMILCMVVLGGLGRIQGAIVGAVVLGVVPELLRALNLVVFRDLIFGAMMVTLVVLRPQGLMGRRHIDI